MLARIPGSPQGTKGISLFLVPKYLVKEDGTIGQRNGVNTGSIETKMGIKGSPTCVLNFENATGYLIGPENKGLNSMFTMMNLERIIVGIQGLGISETAYQNALAYAKERKQGKANDNKTKDADIILKHADIRRSLMNMKSLIEGQRSLAFWVSQLIDVSLNHSDPKIKSNANDLVSLMTPLIKAFFSDIGMEITNDAIQIFGGYGYTKDQGIEQLFRDNRITPIYEGTNSVQAIDLVFRKILNNKIFEKFLLQITEEVKNYSKDKKISLQVQKFQKYLELLNNFTLWLAEKNKSSKNDVSAACNDYLKVFGYICIAHLWLKILKVSYEKYDQNKSFFEDKINTANYYFDKILPRAQSHYLSAITGSDTIMKTNFN